MKKSYVCAFCKHYTGQYWTNPCCECCDGENKYESKIELKETKDALENCRKALNLAYGSLAQKIVTSKSYPTPAIYGYLDTDIAATHRLYEHMNSLRIVRVIFNDPATIVFWSDNTKTIVKAQDGDVFDKEKGLAMAIAKKSLGNCGNYYEEFHKWCK